MASFARPYTRKLIKTDMSYRDRFIVPPGIYLASHSVGALTHAGHMTLNNLFMDPWKERGGEGWENWLSLMDQFCAALARLLGGSARDFCPQTNLSSGLTKYLMALPNHKTRKTILMHNDAFPSMGFVAKALERYGYTLSLIPSQLPAHDPQVWAEAIDGKTACALITHIHSNTGIISPVEDITQICKEQGVRSVVDIAQSAGILPIDVRQWNADAVLGSCVKWLCGGPGAGFMWVNPDRSDDLAPVDVGWFSHENPFEFDIRDFRYAKGAKKFWGGTPNITPYATALGGIETISSIGVQTIRAHNLALMKTVHTDIDSNINGGTLCLPVTDAQDAKLRKANCQFDRRGDVARLSFHIYNRMEEVERVALVFH